MKKIVRNLILISSIIFVVTLIIETSSCSRSPKQVCFDRNCFDVELAITPEERNQGLMYREELGQDSGMLFVFDREDKQCFWMKDTLIPLDIIWLNKNKEVVYVQKSAQPCKSNSCSKICPEQKVKYVLELNAGTCDSLGLGLGDKLSFD